MISLIAVVWIYVAKNAAYEKGVGYLIGVLVGSRVIQCYFVDYHVALIEKIRRTKGWHGLSTSLYVTEDTEQELIQ